MTTGIRLIVINGLLLITSIVIAIILLRPTLPDEKCDQSH